MDQGEKRKAQDDIRRDKDKRAKNKAQWRAQARGRESWSPAPTIQVGDSGIWVTCAKGKEGKCVGELRELFNEYAEKMYGDELQQAPTSMNGENDNDDDDDDNNDNATEEVDIEHEIQAEISQMRAPPTGHQLFTAIKIATPCLVFFRTRLPVDPVSLVRRICEDAEADSANKRTRFVQRLTPITLFDRATQEGLEKVAEQVLAPCFHVEAGPSYKFKINVSRRNHNILSGKRVIDTVAALVGSHHKVDLTDYDRLILVEIYQNVCGISVVDRSYERLKKYNLSEIFDPSPKEAREAKTNNITTTTTTTTTMTSDSTS